MGTDEHHDDAGFDTSHIGRLVEAASRLDTGRIRVWGEALAALFSAGGRVLVAGNGGSAAEAQHLTAELVGRYQHERRALPAIALHADTSTVTAVSNDYGYEEVFARQVRAHGRAGDVLLCLSTSGRSANLLRAAEAAAEIGMTTWALTGRAPNPLAELCDDAVPVDTDAVATVQECHLVGIHVLCASLDAALGVRAPAALAPPGRRRLVVVGDALLDRDLNGAVSRMSPEAPVPVVDSITTTTRPGGAALAAVLAARAGDDVVLVTALADDLDGARLRESLSAEGIEIVDLGLRGRTPVKARVRSGGRTMLMLDETDRNPGAVGAPPADLARTLRDASAILVSDYGRGVAGVPAIRRAIAEVARSVPTVWDPHRAGAPPVAGTCLVTPNRTEAAVLSANPNPGAGATGLDEDTANGRALLEAWGVPRIVVTRGALGALLVENTDRAPLVITAEPATSEDTVGAGDRFAAAVAGGLARGELPSVAVPKAVAVATAFVAAGGVSALAEDAVAPAHEPEAPIALAERVRARGGRVVATGGCFDILHVGHVSMLAEARRLGDCLIVCLNGDASVARLKGPNRPIVPASERAAMLSALRSVDAVLVFDEDTPEQALERLRPDVFVKGGDYAIHELPEAVVVERHGGQVVTVPYVTGRSTTSLIRSAAGTDPNPSLETR